MSTTQAPRLRPVYALCPITVNGQHLLASGGDDSTIRIWDLATGRCLLTVPVYHLVQVIALVGGSMGLGLRSGILAIKLNPVT